MTTTQDLDIENRRLAQLHEDAMLAKAGALGIPGNTKLAEFIDGMAKRIEALESVVSP